MFCAKHKENDMINVKGRSCAGKHADGSACTKQPVFNRPGESHGRFCVKHKENEMVNVVNPACITLHCTTRSSNKAYKGHCYRCFINTYPDNTIVRNHKTKERSVSDFVRSSYPDLTIAFDQRIADGCSRRRPDIFVDMGAYVLVVEVDENQHEAYICSCENRRIMELFQDAGNRPLVMVRFNPDQYFNQKNKSVPSCWGHTKDKGLSIVKPGKTAEWAQRLATLKTTLNLVIAQGTDSEVRVIHLFYDGF
jgi:Holliday junction resolvase